MRESRATGRGLFVASRVAVATAFVASLAGAFWAGTLARHLHLLVGEPVVAGETVDNSSPATVATPSPNASATTPTTSLPEPRGPSRAERVIDVSDLVERADDAIAHRSIDAPASIDDAGDVVASLANAPGPAESSPFRIASDRTSATAKTRERPTAVGFLKNSSSDARQLAPATLLPPISEGASYQPDGAPRFFDAATLCKQFGGSAPEYLDLGCRSLMTQSYTAVDPEDTDCRLFVFDMGGTPGAEAIYRRQRGGIVLTVGIGDAGHRFGATWFFRQGSYYIVVVNTDESKAADRFSQQLARGLSERIRSSLARADALRRGPPLAEQ